jgi:UrcA family protein
MVHRMMISAAAATLALVATTASAGSVEPGDSVAVRFGDLDLKTDKGVATLKRRIDRAATQACGTYSFGDLKRMAAVDACRNYALNSATPEIRLAVAAAHRGESYASGGASINVRSR